VRALLIDLTSEVASVEDTAALVSNLDLVISIDSMTAHLSGALNIPTWVMCDVNPYWGWGDRAQIPSGSRSVRIYRQARMHDWTNVFEEVQRATKEMVKVH
jgi:hypothetical protein